jgi:hypothetical protein
LHAAALLLDFLASSAAFAFAFTFAVSAEDEQDFASVLSPAPHEPQ